MTSAKVPSVPDARGTRIGIIFGSIFKNRRKIVRKFILEGFRGSQSRICHRRRSQVYLVPGELVSASFSGVFLKIEEKLFGNYFSGVFQVVNHEYDISEGPRYTWCPRELVLASSWGIFLKIEGKSIGTLFSGISRGRWSWLWWWQWLQVYLVSVFTSDYSY